MALQIDSTITLASGAQLPRLGLGVYQARSSECVEAVRTAIGAGYRHIDTAQGYRNEDYPPKRPTWYAATTLNATALTQTVVGRGIASTSLSRSSLYITTKYMPSHTPQSASAVYIQLCKSLKPLHRGPLIPPTREGKAELKRRIAAGEAEEPPREKEEVEPYIDLFLVHAPWGGQEGREANWAALRRAKEEGWVRDIGVSNFGVKHLESLPDPKPAVNQIELHPWCQQKPIVAYCQANGIALQAYCPLVRADQKRWQDPVLQEVCKKVGKGEAQVLVRWSLQKGFAALPKSVTPDRIRSNADVYNFELDEEDMAKLDSLDEGAEGACSWNPVEAD